MRSSMLSVPFAETMRRQDLLRALRLVLAWARSWQNKRQYTGGNILPPVCKEQSSKQLLTQILTNNICDVKTQKKMLKGDRSKRIPAAMVEVFQGEGIDFRTWL